MSFIKFNRFPLFIFGFVMLFSFVIAQGGPKPYEGAKVNRVTKCSGEGDGKKSYPGKGGKLVHPAKPDKFDLLRLEGLPSGSAQMKYPGQFSGGENTPGDKKCYTQSKEKFEEKRGICCKKIRKATIAEEKDLGTKHVCDSEGKGSTYNVVAKDKINFAEGKNCKEMEEGLGKDKPKNTVGGTGGGCNWNPSLLRVVCTE